MPTFAQLRPDQDMLAPGQSGVPALLTNFSGAPATLKDQLDQFATGNKASLSDMIGSGIASFVPDTHGNMVSSVNSLSGGTDAMTVGTANPIIVYQDGTRVSAAAAASVSVAAADATNPRIDLVCVNTSGAVVSSGADATCKGTAGATPAQPATPAGYVLLAAIAVAATVTAIHQANITPVAARFGGASSAGNQIQQAALQGNNLSGTNVVAPGSVGSISDQLEQYAAIIQQIAGTAHFGDAPVSSIASLDTALTDSHVHHEYTLNTASAGVAANATILLDRAILTGSYVIAYVRSAAYLCTVVSTNGGTGGVAQVSVDQTINQNDVVFFTYVAAS